MRTAREGPALVVIFTVPRRVLPNVCARDAEPTSSMKATETIMTIAERIECSFRGFAGCRDSTETHFTWVVRKEASDRIERREGRLHRAVGFRRRHLEFH